MVRPPVLPLSTCCRTVTDLGPPPCLRTPATGPLGSAAFEIVQEVERVLERTTEKSKALFVDGMGEVMGVELM